MYRRRKQGWSFGRLGEYYGIKKQTVYDVVKREEKKEIEKKSVRSI